MGARKLLKRQPTYTTSLLSVVQLALTELGVAVGVRAHAGAAEEKKRTRT
jgi:hypothetical protein